MLPRHLLLFLAAALIGTSCTHEPEAAPAVETDEAWSLMLVDGAEAGYAHSTTVPITAGGFETTVETLFRMRRLGGDVEVATTVTTTEDRNGQVTRLKQVAKMAANETVSDGVVVDGTLEIVTRTMGKDWPSTAEWPDDVPGPVEQRRRRVAAGANPGASITFEQFDFTIGDSFEVTVTVVGPDRIELDGRAQDLLKVSTASDILPETIAWSDADGNDLQTVTSMMGLEIKTVPTTREHVTQFLESDVSAEIFMQSTITSNVRLPRPRSLDAITYRLRPKQAGGELPALEDERQSIAGSEGDATLLRIVTVVPPESRRQTRPIANPAADLAPFLEPNSFLQSDHPMLIEMAAGGFGDERDAWNAAVRLESLVREKIDEKSLDVAFATALEVCRDRRGDCSEHAVLLAALCRSAGIPSRVAMGLVYVGGIFGGHAWTEVSIDGEWYALDGTIGAGSADPTHIRLGVTSLANGGLSSGMLGIVKGLGMMDLEIASYARGEDVVQVESTRARASVEDGVFRDRIEGISFAVPEGWRAEPGATDILEMSNRFEVARLHAEASTAEVRVQSIQVPREWTLDDFTAELGSSEAWTERHIAGRPGRVATITEGGATIRMGAFQVEETVYTVATRSPDDRALEAFELVLGTLTTGGR